MFTASLIHSPYTLPIYICRAKANGMSTLSVFRERLHFIANHTVAECCAPLVELPTITEQSSPNVHLVNALYSVRIVCTIQGYNNRVHFIHILRSIPNYFHISVSFHLCAATLCAVHHSMICKIILGVFFSDALHF